MLGDKDLVPRTILADKFNGHIKEVFFLNQKWEKITSNVNFVGHKNTKWLSLGASPVSSGRERLLINLNSPTLISLKSQAEKLCQGKSIPKILKTIVGFVNGLAPKHDAVKKTEEYVIAKYHKGHTYITLDEFIQEKLLICRHKTPIVISILTHLVEKGILPKGIVRQYRSDVTEGAHTWTLFRDVATGKLWVCDPSLSLHGEVESIKSQLNAEYGQAAVKAMIKRVDILDASQINPPQADNLEEVEAMEHKALHAKREEERLRQQKKDDQIRRLIERERLERLEREKIAKEKEKQEKVERERLEREQEARVKAAREAKGKHAKEMQSEHSEQELAMYQENLVSTTEGIEILRKKGISDQDPQYQTLLRAQEFFQQKVHQSMIKRHKEICVKMVALDKEVNNLGKLIKELPEIKPLLIQKQGELRDISQEFRLRKPMVDAYRKQTKIIG